MSINLTDEIEVKTKKGKLGAAKQIFLEGDTQTVENEIQDINSRHNDLSSKHESLSSTVSEHTKQIESNQSQITANKSAQDEKNTSLDANMAKLNTRDDQITELVKGVTATGGASVATAVTYDNEKSGLTAVNAQAAIDEVSSIGHFAKRGGIVNISTNYNSTNTAEVLTLNQAVSKVPSTDRVLGFQGKYLATDGWHTIIYIGDSLTSWNDTTKWIDLSDKIFKSISKNATFAGIATPTTNPGTPDGNVFYIAGEGTYTNFSEISVDKGELAVLTWNGTWSKQSLKVGLPPNELNISYLFPTNGEGGTNRYTLAEAITQVPVEYRVSGLKVSFTNENGVSETWRNTNGVWDVINFVRDYNLFDVFQSVGLEENSNHLFTIKRKLIDNKGNIKDVSSDAFTITDFIPLFGQSFEVFNSTIDINNYTIAFYKDRSGTKENFLGGVGVGYQDNFNKIYNKEDYTFGGVVAKYVVISALNNNVNSKVPPLQNIVEVLLSLDNKDKEIIESINTLSNILSECIKDKIDLSTEFQSVGLEDNSNHLFTVQNRFIRDNGNFGSLHGYVSTDFIPLFGQSFEVFNTQLHNSLRTVAFYKDKNGTAESFLGGSDLIQQIGYNKTYNKEDYTFDGIVAKYVVIMSQCGDDYIPTNSNIKFPPYKNMVETLVLLQEQIVNAEKTASDANDSTSNNLNRLERELNEKLETVEESAKNTNYTWGEKEDNDTIFTISGSYINIAGMIGSLASYKRSDMIKLDLRCISYKGRLWDSISEMAFYKSAEISASNFLGAYAPEKNENIDVVITPDDYTFNGVTAKYVVFSQVESVIGQTEIAFTERISQQVVMLQTNAVQESLIKDVVRLDKTILTDLWQGKNIGLYGDSITSWSGNEEKVDRWGGLVASVLKCKITPRGWGGTTYKTNKYGEPAYLNEDGSIPIEPIETPYTVYDRGFCSWERITKMFPPMIKDNIDAVIIMGGTNDLGGDIVEGDTAFILDTEKEPLDIAWKNSPYYKDWNGDFDTSKLSGAICSTILKFQLWMPNAVIIIASMIGGASYNNFTNSLPNGSNGIVLPQSPVNKLTQWDYAKIMEKVSSYMNTPYIDVWRNSGISIFNRKWMIKDGVHPYPITDAAGKKHNDGDRALAKAIIGGLYGITPRFEWFEFADKSYNITIHVTDESGNVEGATVTLVSGKETFTFSGATDTEGNYTVAAWGRIVYKVTVSSGDKSYSGYINVADDETFEITI